VSGLFWLAGVLWYMAGFASYLFWETRHRLELQRRWQPAKMRYFPELVPGLFLAGLGPLLFLIGRHARPAPAIKPAESVARASREHPIVAVDLEAEVDLKEAIR
jgi:hypothetical protein